MFRQKMWYAHLVHWNVFESHDFLMTKGPENNFVGTVRPLKRSRIEYFGSVGWKTQKCPNFPKTKFLQPSKVSRAVRVLSNLVLQVWTEFWFFWQFLTWRRTSIWWILHLFGDKREIETNTFSLLFIILLYQKLKWPFVQTF